MASGGYPGSYPSGKPISGLDEAASLSGVTVFHAGTAFREPAFAEHFTTDFSVGNPSLDPERTTSSITDIVTAIGPNTAADTFKGPIESITSNRGTAGLLQTVTDLLRCSLRTAGSSERNWMP